MNDSIIVDCSENALDRLTAYCTSHQLDRFLLVSDENTYAALGERTEGLLKDRGWDVRTVVVNGPEVTADEEHICEVLIQAGGEKRTYLAVGSGTLTDITRFASHASRNGFISLPTAPSVDGYASSGAALTIKRLKTTVVVHAPSAIFADLPTLCAAPREMIAAGFGDVLGKYTSLADWRLGALLLDERFDDAIAQRVHGALMACVENAQEIGKAGRTGITHLMAALVESGLCMMDFGNSRPASGTEHVLSHYWEMTLLQEGRPAVLHGAKVGIATIQAARRYEAIRGLSKEDVLGRLARAAAPDRAAEIARMRAGFGPIAEQIVADHVPFLEMLETNIGTLRKKIGDRWNDIQAIAATVPPAERVVELLQQAGGPTDAGALGIGEDEVQRALAYAHYMRRRFTVTTLGHLLELW